ncbi:hypothetical protein VTK73DRAFT_3567 [Phialemonium thermophilum]|uniref:Uncharacterized protein n=1 Tax=Phialemonium thermophilum TaxID=223376 RepID=A0ABR3VHK6_9PEZI
MDTHCMATGTDGPSGFLSGSFVCMLLCHDRLVEFPLRGWNWEALSGPKDSSIRYPILRHRNSIGPSFPGASKLSCAADASDLSTRPGATSRRVAGPSVQVYDFPSRFAHSEARNQTPLEVDGAPYVAFVSRSEGKGWQVWHLCFNPSKATVIIAVVACEKWGDLGEWRFSKRAIGIQNLRVPRV